jgi:hypothetical protein
VVISANRYMASEVNSAHAWRQRRDALFTKGTTAIGGAEQMLPPQPMLKPSFLVSVRR